MSKRSGWTIDTVREHFDQRFLAQEAAVKAALAAADRAVAAALAAADRAVAKAETAAEKRFEGVNEFRGTLSDQQRTLMPRAEAMVLIDGLKDDVRGAQRILEGMQAERQGQKGGWGMAVGIVGLCLAVASLIGMLVRAVGP